MSQVAVALTEHFLPEPSHRGLTIERSQARQSRIVPQQHTENVERHHPRLADERQLQIEALPGKLVESLNQQMHSLVRCDASDEQDAARTTRALRGRLRMKANDVDAVANGVHARRQVWKTLLRPRSHEVGHSDDGVETCEVCTQEIVVDVRKLILMHV